MSKNTRMYGIIGLILILVGMVLGFVVPGIGIIQLIGLILILLAYFNSSKELGEPLIKKYVLYALVIAIVGSIIASVTTGTTLIGGVKKISLSKLSGGALVGFIIAWILTIIASSFWYKANILMSDKTAVNLFKTGGLLIFIGAIGSIIFRIGSILMLIGYILLLIAFINVRPVETA